MLLEATVSRSWPGVRLALQPALLLGALLIALVSTHRLLPTAVGGPVALLVTAVWCWWSTALLPRRAAKVGAWLRERVAKRGGDPDPVQPIQPPTALEINKRNAPGMLVSLEAMQLAFMRHPGRDSRRVLALGGVALWTPNITAVAIGDTGPVTWIAMGPCTIVAGIATTDLFRGLQRRMLRPWRTTRGPWPQAWKVIDKPSKMLGPIWLVLAVLFLLATGPISHAGSVSRGVTLIFLLTVPVFALWTGRSELGPVAAAIERTGPHRTVARWLVRLAPAVWWSALAVQVTLVSAGLAAMALSPIDDSASYLGILILGIALMLRSMRLEWQRPQNPIVVDVDEVASLLEEQHLQLRVKRVLVAFALASGVWFYLRAVT